MQLFRVPIFLPLLVLTFWAVPDGVYGTCAADTCKNSGKCGSTGCDCDGTGYDGPTCEHDTDECSASLAPCDVNADCTNTIGSYTCTCKSGYAGDGKTCTDIDECTVKGTGKHDCHEHANCTNTPGSYTCTCKSGYAGDGKTCTEGVCSKDGKECLNEGKCDTSKTPTTCTCANGYKGATCQNAGGTVTISAYLLSLIVVTFSFIQ